MHQEAKEARKKDRKFLSNTEEYNTIQNAIEKKRAHLRQTKEHTYTHTHTHIEHACPSPMCQLYSYSVFQVELCNSLQFE